MDLRRRLEILFEDKGKPDVDMDVLMEDLEVVRPYLRGAPLAMTDPLAVSINEAPRRKELLKVLTRLREDIEQLQSNKQAVEALLEISSRKDDSITSVIDLRSQLESLRINLCTTEEWVDDLYKPKGGSAPKHYPDMKFMIALYKEHVDSNPSSTPAGLFSEFVNEIASEIQPNTTVESLRSRIEAGLADTRNQVNLENFRNEDPAIRKQIEAISATERPLILVEHPNMDVWKDFLKTADDYLS